MTALLSTTPVLGANPLLQPPVAPMVSNMAGTAPLPPAVLFNPALTSASRRKPYNTPTNMAELKEQWHQQPVSTLFKTLPALQTTMLLVTGVASSLMLGWFAKGLKLSQPALAVSLKGLQNSVQSPIQSIERQTGIIYSHPLVSALLVAMKYQPVQQRLKAYLSAAGLGFIGASTAQGAQEVWVRRAETQQRADLLERLKTTFEQSLQLKHQSDETLRGEALAQLQQRLQQAGRGHLAPQLSTVGVAAHHPYWRFPFEPVHLTHESTLQDVQRDPNFNATKSVPNRFGALPASPMLSDEPNPSPLPQTLLKTALVGVGMLGGLAYGGLMRLLAQAPKAEALDAAKHSLLEITNIRDWEALFLTANRKVLWTVMGVAALAKLGQLGVEGYREIEVTRQHSQTEYRYQRHNWLALDPSFHDIAEKKALERGLKQFEAMLTTAASDAQVVGQAQQLMNNIGKESAPKYFPMTPSVNLVAARG